MLRDGKEIEVDPEGVEKEIRARRETFRKERPNAKPDEGGPFPFRTVVVARRYGAIVPNTVEVRFEDGTTERLPWEANGRWERWVFEKPVRATSAQIDPGRAFLLDLIKLDDGRTRESHPLASTRWTLEASAWTQAVLALLESL